MREIKTLIGSEALYNSFSSFRQDAEGVGEALLPKSYDLENMSFLIWLGILFGGPVFFCFISKKQQKEEEVLVKGKISAPFEKEIRELSGNFHQSRSEAWNLKQRLEELTAEIERLKARDEYLTCREKPPSEPTGILDSKDI